MKDIGDNWDSSAKLLFDEILHIWLRYIKESILLLSFVINWKNFLFAEGSWIDWRLEDSYLKSAKDKEYESAQLKIKREKEKIRRIGISWITAGKVGKTNSIIVVKALRSIEYDWIGKELLIVLISWDDFIPVGNKMNVGGIFGIKM